MKNRMILFSAILFFVILLPEAFSLPPHPILTTSISLPPTSVPPKKVLEVSFSINKNHQLTLENISIQNKPEVIINTDISDYSMKITDANNNVLFSAKILTVFDSSGVSRQYYAIPYPNGAKYLYFYYQNQQIAKYDMPQEFPWFYVMIGIIAAAIILIIYFISKKYTIQI